MKFDLSYDLLDFSSFNAFPSTLCPKPFNNEYPRKKILHISSELSQLAIRYNWRYLRSKSAIVYDGGKAKCGRGLVHRWLNENCSGQQVQLIPTIGSKFLSLRKCSIFFYPPDLHQNMVFLLLSHNQIFRNNFHTQYITFSVTNNDFIHKICC